MSNEENDEDNNVLDFNVTIIPNEFIFARFDSYTVDYFLLIAAGAQNSSIEFQNKLSKNIGISFKQIQYCENLLVFCNIIKIENIYDPTNKNVILKRIITILEIKQWNLNHTFRNAEQFYNENKDSLPPLIDI